MTPPTLHTHTPLAGELLLVNTRSKVQEFARAAPVL